MERLASPSRHLVRLAVVVLAACSAGTPPARSIDPNAPIVIPYKVDGGGEIRFTVQPRYFVGDPVKIDLDLTAGTVGIRGPLAGRVLQSALGGEQTIRRLGATGLGGVDVDPGQREHTSVTWDGKDDSGVAVRRDTYSLSLDFIIGTKTMSLGSVIEVRER
jgi:hypothetical protein